jgi:protein-L-isoaspartate(D-aspartate) O-methyltransferase
MRLVQTAAQRLCRVISCGGLLLASLIGMITSAEARETHAAQRKAMLEDIARMAHETRRETGRATLSDPVMAAMGRVERHRLVSAGDEAYAYHNRPLAIGLGQTISQPFIVALMTDLLEVRSGDRVLEVGTGSGYQAAVLAELGAQVYTVEVLEPLARKAADRLGELGYRQIQVRVGDGHQGWPEHAPFDAIIVTAAASDVPAPLIDQMKPGGRLVIPIGTPLGAQTLYLIKKQSDGTLARHEILGVRFVPLRRGPVR